MRFKNWLLKENATRTGAKLGLYPTVNDALGQYPPLYGIPTAADLITYIYIYNVRRQWNTWQKWNN